MTVECPKSQHENPGETAFCGKCGFFPEKKMKILKSQKSSQIISVKNILKILTNIISGSKKIKV